MQCDMKEYLETIDSGRRVHVFLDGGEVFEEPLKNIAKTYARYAKGRVASMAAKVKNDN